MYPYRHLALFFALSITLAGCTALAPEPPRLRIVNTSAFAIENLTVIFPQEQIPFGNVPAGATTEYRPVPAGVYRYAAYRFLINGALVTQPVTDWVGEKPMEGNSFTYFVEFDPTQLVPQMIRHVQVTRD